MHDLLNALVAIIIMWIKVLEHSIFNKVKHEKLSVN